MFPDHLTTLAAHIVAQLAARGESLATAESCTGGLIAALVTEIPGASRVFRYGWVTYCNEAKSQELAVPRELIARHTVVSEPVVQAMAASARQQAAAHYALAVSGNAGPTAAPGEPAVGTVCLALAAPRRLRSLTLVHPGLSRHAFRLLVVDKALQLLQEELAPSPRRP